MTKRQGAALATEHHVGSVPAALRHHPVSANRFGSAADGMVEATCLVAVAILPLYFFLLSPLGPETDKAVILIALAVIAAGAWLAGEIDRVAHHDPRFSSNPLIWAGLAVFAVYAVATALSIHPAVSLFGTISRHQGLLTHAAYTVFFICVATRLRRREQVRRLVTVLTFASLPAVLYGIVQQFGIDPAPTVGDISTVQWPVRSSFGQHIFFAAYLVLVIPLTGARLLDLWDRRTETPRRGAGDEALLAVSLSLSVGLSFLGVLAIGKHLPATFVILPAVLAGYVLLAVVFDELPDTASVRRVRLWGYAVLLALQILALIFTSARGPWLGFFATLPVFALLIGWRLHRPRISWTVLGAAGAVALFVLLLNIPGGPLQPLRTKHLFNRIANIQGYVNESSGAGRLEIWRGVGDLMTHQPAVGNTWGGIGRAVVGYGPESMDAAFEAVFPLKLRVETSEVYTWDRAHSIYLDTLVDAGLAGLLALLATVVLFLWRVLRPVAGRKSAGWLAVGLASAVAGHLVEGLFGLETAASLLIFWVILGLGAGSTLSEEGAETGDAVPLRWPRLTLGYWLALLLVGVVVMVWTSLPDHPGISMALWLCAIVGGVAAVAWLVVPRTPAPARRSTKAKQVARETAPSVSSTPRATILATGVVFILVLLGLLSQWNYETAALAETAGFRNLTHGFVTGGIADLQEAASMEDGQPRYQQDLATVYGGIASANPQSNDPAYVPHGDDPRTIDPQRVLTLGGTQLDALGVLSLQAARALTPLDPTVYRALGDLYMDWGKPDQALAVYRQAERLSHDNPKYVDAEARAQLLANEPKTALATARFADSLDKKFWYTHYTLARIYQALHQKARAREEATLGLFWAPVFQPPPPKNQLDELRKIQRAG